MKPKAFVLPQSLDDLAPDPQNPRQIAEAAAQGLAASLLEFGDISAIVWNARTGQLVAGHQRVARLRALGADLHVDARVCELRLPDGKNFQVRVVDWTARQQRTANLLANSPAIAGEFTGLALDHLEGLQVELPNFGDLRLDALLDLLRDDPTMPPRNNRDIDEAALSDTANECPKCGFQW